MGNIDDEHRETVFLCVQVQVVPVLRITIDEGKSSNRRSIRIKKIRIVYTLFICWLSYLTVSDYTMVSYFVNISIRRITPMKTSYNLELPLN